MSPTLGCMSLPCVYKYVYVPGARAETAPCTVLYSYCNVEPVFGGLWARNVSIGGRAVADRKRGNEIVLSNTTH